MKGLITTCLLLLTIMVQGQDSLRVLDLRQCIDIAIDNNLTVKRSNLTQKGNEVNLSQARANRYPDLNFGAGYGINWGRSIDPTTNLFITQQIVTSGINGSANLQLFNGGRIHNSIKQSEIDVQSSQLDVEKAKNDIGLFVATGYLTVILNKELVENARFQVESSKQQLDRTKKLVQSGALPRTSELELISQVASNEVNLINAQNNLALSKLDLKQLMLVPSSQQIEIIVPEMELDSIPRIQKTAEDVYNTALGLMPEIQSADLKVQSAQYGVKVSNGNIYPSLSIRGNLFTNYSDAADRPRTIFDDDNEITVPVEIGYFDASGTRVPVFRDITTGTPIREEPDFKMLDQWNENFSQSFSVNLSIPVFNNLNTRSNIQRSKIQLQQAEITAVEQRNTLRQSIETAYNQAVSASNSYAASLRQVEALEETFRVIENQYNLGAANFTDYQVASNNLFGAKSDLVRAKYSFIFRMAVLDFYQGIPITLE